VQARTVGIRMINRQSISLHIQILHCARGATSRHRPGPVTLTAGGKSMSQQIDPPVPQGVRPIGDLPLRLHGVSGEETAAIVAEFLRTAHLMRCLLSSHFAAFGLTETWFTVLEVLSRSAQDGCSQAQLAVEIGQSESSVSTLIERMRSHGLLLRLRSKSDRRRHVLVSTEQGRTIYSAVRECHHQRTTHLLSGLRANELGTFSDLLNRLGTELARLKSSGDAGEMPNTAIMTMSDAQPSPETAGPNAQRKPAA